MEVNHNESSKTTQTYSNQYKILYLSIACDILFSSLVYEKLCAKIITLGRKEGTQEKYKLLYNGWVKQ